MGEVECRGDMGGKEKNKQDDATAPGLRWDGEAVGFWKE